MVRGASPRCRRFTMILTLTLNPAIDRTLTVDRLVFEDRSYINSCTESAGGRGINASRVIRSFGGNTVAIVPSGGPTGEKFEEFLRVEKFPVEVVPIRQEIRTNLTITDRQGLTIKLNEHGPKLTKAELQGVERVVRTWLPDADWILLCGSLPPGVPPDFYARMIELARREEVKTLLDTDGPALAEGIRARPNVVFPNRNEAEELLDTVLLTRRQSLDAAAKMAEMGAESVVLSLGSRGAVGLFDGRQWEALAPPVDALSPIGAGDALAAAFSWARDNGTDFPGALRWGVAAGTASACLPGMNFASHDETAEMLPRVEMREA